MIKMIYAIFFSPTGNTATITRYMAKAIAEMTECQLKEIDLTMAANREETYIFSEEDFVVVGAPTYAGKLPNKILPFYQEQLKGSKTPAIAVVTYGNRSFDNALAELSATLLQNGFVLTGASAMVGEHPFSEKLGTARPDRDDCKEADDFVKIVVKRIKSECADMVSEDFLKAIPGDAQAPYYIPKGIDGQPAVFLKAKPKTDGTKCTNCKKCVQNCPMGSIDTQDAAIVNGICIKCHACIKNCPQGAKYFDDEAFLSHVRMLEENFTAKNGNLFV